MDKKKLVLISNQYPDHIDGVGDYTAILGKALEKDCELFYIHRNSLINKSNHLIIKEWNRNAIDPILNFLIANKADWLILQYVPHGFDKKALPFWIISLCKELQPKKIKLFVMFHEFAIGYSSINLKQNIAATLQRYIAKKLCHYSEHTATSTDLYYLLLSKYDPDIIKIPIGPNIFSDNLKPVHKNHERLFLGTFSNRLNLDLLKGFQKLLNDGINCCLKVYGKPQEQIKEFIRSEKLEADIIFIGYLAPEIMYQELDTLDIYLQLEHVDEKGRGGISLKSGLLATMMSLGKPIMTTKGHMTDDDLINLNIFYYVKLEYASIYEGLHILLNNVNLRKDLKERSKAYFEAKLTWENITKTYIHFINA